MNNVPVIVIRTISDGLNENTSKYKQNKQTISKIPAKIIIAVLKADK